MGRTGDTRRISRHACVGLLLLLAIVTPVEAPEAAPSRFTLAAPVVGADGDPLDTFTVKVLARGAAATPWTGWTEKAVGLDGRFRFEHVAPGNYRLSVRSTSGVAERRELHVVNGDHLVVELHLEPLGGISGWIDGLQESESVWINVYRNDDPQSRVRGSDRAFGNGPSKCGGSTTGLTWSELRWPVGGS